MSYYPDGGHRWESYRNANLVTIGWMDAPHPIPRGDVKPRDFVRLEKLIHYGWTFEEQEGTHSCTFCFGDPDAEPIRRMVCGHYHVLGWRHVVMPGKRRLYLVSDQILHYVEAHYYKPPDQFLRALRRVDPRDPEYVRRCEEMWAKIEADPRQDI